MNEKLILSMLKNFGFDPEELKARFQGMAEKAVNSIESIEKKLASLEADQKLLLACYDEAYIKAAREKLARKHNGEQSTGLIQHSVN